MARKTEEKTGKKDAGVIKSQPRKPKTKFAWLNVLPDDLWLKVNRGETIWEALKDEDVGLEGECGGLGKCGKCKVKVISSIGPPTKEERKLLDSQERKRGVRLACRTSVTKDLMIDFGESDEGMEYFQILKAGYRPLMVLDPPVTKRIVTVDPEEHAEGLSELDRIKLVLGPQYQDLRASLHCLRRLPARLNETGYHGAAVLHENTLLDWQPWKKIHSHFGLVFDLGTSTLVGKLIDLFDGNEVAAVSRLNSQIKYGSNIISRLQYVIEHTGGLEHMRDLLVKDLNFITRRLLEVHGLAADDVFMAVAAGNTTMQHLLLEVDPSGIAEADFTPVLTDGMVLRAADAGLNLHPDALLYMMPAKSGYIGGDMMSVILASGAADSDDVSLGLDIGTNGEIFLGNRNRIMTCSAAAGPALEGGRISQGMIAKAGAIEGVRQEGDKPYFQVIGNVRPRGICGSGLVELASLLRQLGIMDHEGFIKAPAKKNGDFFESRIVRRAGVNDVMLVSGEESYDGKPVFLTQNDIRELQLAKGAIAAGIQTLMDEMGVKTGDIRNVYLAGALGNYINPLSAIRIGLIPAVDPEIIKSIGNAASTGASMVLLSKAYWERANDLARFIEHVELSSRSDFNEYFVEHMDFPESED